ncbi:MAG TPA: outer membrane lipoprotein carrier protein LolA [Thermoanaerobaculia bacterium]|nr:outer membrane lipoprotein carrier protein LolA [Thermoanaerobaculia bacterium]
MRRLAFLLALSIAFVSAGFASTPTVSRSIGAVAGMRADFVQRFTPKGFKREQVEQGSVLFGSAPKMRWSYRAPEEKLFLFDGKTSTFYVASDRQATLHDLSDVERRDLPFLLLTQPEELKRLFIVSETRSGGQVVTRLTPKQAAAIREVIVTTALGDNLIRRLEYSDKQGNRTVFEFSKYQKAVSSPADFTFSAPKGVEVVKN